MSKNISITINEQNLKYLDSQIDNRSKFEASMRQGYIAQSQNKEMQEEDELWEVTIGDGIEDEN